MAKAFLSSVKVESLIAHHPSTDTMVSFDADQILPDVLKVRWPEGRITIVFLRRLGFANRLRFGNFIDLGRI